MSFEGRRRREAGAFPPPPVACLAVPCSLCGPRTSCVARRSRLGLLVLLSSSVRLPQSGCCLSGLRLGVELLDPMLILCLPF